MSRRSCVAKRRASRRRRRRSSSRIFWKRSTANSSARHRARQFVLQGLYEGQLSGNSTEAIRARLAADTNFAKADRTYFDVLWSGVNTEYEALIETIAGSIDRRVSQLS